MLRIVRFLVCLGILGCAAHTGLPAGIDLHAPKPVPWTERETGAPALWPESVHHAQIILTQGSLADERYAWGIADSRKVVFAYSMSVDGVADFVHAALGDLPKTANHDLSKDTWGVNQSTTKPPVGPPGPPGEPPEVFVRRLLNLAIRIDRANTEMPEAP